MDEVTFDRLVTRFGVERSRRSALGLVAGSVLGGLAGRIAGSETDARGKKGKPKGKGKKKDQKRCKNCNACQSCDRADGKCRPNADKNGQACSGCLTCSNGACGIGDDALCPSGQRCRQSTGMCCPRCLDEQCCPVGQVCINPGLFATNTCCDSSVNTPCGSNGDGTFRTCCSNFNESCVNDTCVPKDECPTRQRSLQGVCCPYGDSCNGVCCGEDEVCGVDKVCENLRVCPRVFCSNRGLRCCPPNSFTDTAYCCDPGQVCVNTVVGCATS